MYIKIFETFQKNQRTWFVFIKVAVFKKSYYCLIIWKSVNACTGNTERNDSFYIQILRQFGKTGFETEKN